MTSASALANTALSTRWTMPKISSLSPGSPTAATFIDMIAQTYGFALWKAPRIGVGRRGLEPRTSAVTGPERCAYDLRELDFDERCSRCYVGTALRQPEPVSPLTGRQT